MANKIRVMLANHNRESLIAMKNLLQSFEGVKVVCEVSNGSEAIDKVLAYQPDIIIMDVNLPVIDGYAAAKKLTRVAPYIGVILIGSAESIDVIRLAMQCGANDFLDLPLTGEKLFNAINALYEVKQQQKLHLLQNPLTIPNRQPKIITVFSSKGGVGKTMMAVNIAVALREMTRDDVLLLDLDLQFGDIADLMNMAVKASITDLVSDKESIAEEEILGYLSSHDATGIKVLPAPKQPEQADLVSAESIRELMPVLLKMFDYIVIDLPPLFNEITLSAIGMSDHLLLITTMEVPTIKNIKAGLEILERFEYPREKINLVINRYNNSREVSLDDVRRFLGIQKLTCIEENGELVSTSINLGEPLVLKYKGSAIANQIIQLTKGLVDFKRKSNTGENKSFLAKLFRKGR